MALRFGSCLLLVNPTRHPGMARSLSRILSKASGIDVVVTSSRNHFVTQARDFVSSPYRYLLVWGGDGTAHDAINAVFTAQQESAESAPESTDKTSNRRRARRKAIGFLRGGTGNGIQDSYSVPYGLRRQLVGYARSVRNNYTIDVDLMKVTHGNRTRFAQLVGSGVDADILLGRERRAKVVRDGRVFTRSGVFHYLSAGVSEFFRFDFANRREFGIELIDGRYAFHGPRVNAQFPFEKVEMWRAPLMIEAGTRPYYGKLFRVCPEVTCNNGLFDVYLFDFRNRLEALRNLPYLWTGRHNMINRRQSRANKPVIERYEVREATISRREPFEYHIDGELMRADVPSDDGTFVVKIQVVPRAIRFLVPTSFYNLFHPFQEEPDVFLDGDPGVAPVGHDGGS